MSVCKAVGCSVPVCVERVFCGDHWLLVPAVLRRALFDEYSFGTPTKQYKRALRIIANHIRRVEAAQQRGMA